MVGSAIFYDLSTPFRKRNTMTHQVAFDFFSYLMDNDDEDSNEEEDHLLFMTALASVPPEKSSRASFYVRERLECRSASTKAFRFGRSPRCFLR